MAHHPNKHIREAIKYAEAGGWTFTKAGCDDGSILNRGAVTIVQFDRDASTLDEALASAIRDVEGAGFQVARVEIERHEVPENA